MPRQTPPGHQGVYVQVPLELKDRLEALVGKTGRTLQAEIVHAIQRHLDVPPVVTVVPLPPSKATYTPAKKGRKPKETS